MIRINTISNYKAWYRYIKNPSVYIENKVNKINSNLKKYKKKTIFCTLLLSGNNEIKRLNKKFRKKNNTTDVLSFPFYNKRVLKNKLRKEKEIYIGDIIINFNEIKDKKKLKNFKIEFNDLWIHGLVHLFGYDHKKEKDYLVMKKIEKKYSSFIND